MMVKETFNTERPPTYVFLGAPDSARGGCALRLEFGFYHRWAGGWKAGYKEVNGFLLATVKDLDFYQERLKHCEGVPFYTCTKNEWLVDNGLQPEKND